MRGTVSPVSFLLLIAVYAMAVNVLRDRIPKFACGVGGAAEGSAECPAGDPSFCDEGVLARPNAARIVLQASETCTNVGYLCAELEESALQHAYRWPDGTARPHGSAPHPLPRQIATVSEQRSVDSNIGTESPSS